MLRSESNTGVMRIAWLTPPGGAMSRLPFFDSDAPPPSGRPVKFLHIKPGTPATPCKHCGRSIYLVAHPTTKRPHPVSLSHALAVAPTKATWGLGTTHYADSTCPRSRRRSTRAAADTLTLSLGLDR